MIRRSRAVIFECAYTLLRMLGDYNFRPDCIRACYLKNAKCLLGMYGVLVGTTVLLG